MKHQSFSPTLSLQRALQNLVAELLKTMLPDVVDKNLSGNEVLPNLARNNFHGVPHAERKDMIALAFGFPNLPPLD